MIASQQLSVSFPVMNGQSTLSLALLQDLAAWPFLVQSHKINDEIIEEYENMKSEHR